MLRIIKTIISLFSAGESEDDEDTCEKKAMVAAYLSATKEDASGYRGYAAAFQKGVRTVPESDRNKMKKERMRTYV